VVVSILGAAIDLREAWRVHNAALYVELVLSQHLQQGIKRVLRRALHVALKPEGRLA
jgi:hypothetical protein